MSYTTDELSKMKDADLLQLITCDSDIYNEILYRIKRANRSNNMLLKTFGYPNIPELDLILAEKVNKFLEVLEISDTV